MSKRIVFMGLGLFLAVTNIQCGVGPDEHAIAALEQAIAEISKDSSTWNLALNQAIDQLNLDSEKLIKDELTNMLVQASQAIGIELRCGVGFIGDRVNEQLQTVLATLKGQPAPPLTPVACQPSPPVVDVADVSSGRTDHVVIDGYNFPLPTSKSEAGGALQRPPRGMPKLDASGAISMFVEDLDSGARHDFTEKLVINTFYELTIPFGNSGVQLTATSAIIVLTWGSKTIAQVAVTQPIVAPPCVLSVFAVPSSVRTYTPNTLTHGDKDFWAGGGLFEPAHKVQVDVTVITHVLTNSITTDVYVTFTEMGGDSTTVIGNWGETRYTTDPHVTIQSVISGGGAFHEEYLHYEPTSPYDWRFASATSIVQSTKSYGFLGNVGVASVDIMWQEIRLQLSGPPEGSTDCTH